MARVKHTAKGNDSDSSQKKKTLKTTKSKKSKLPSESQTIYNQKTVLKDSRHQTSILNYTGTKGSKNTSNRDNESMHNSRSTFIDKSIGVDKNRKSVAAGGKEKMKRKLELQKNAQYSPEG